MKHLVSIIIAFCMCQVVCAQEDLADSANSYAEKGEFDKAIECIDKAIVPCKKEYGEMSSDYAYLLLLKGAYTANVGKGKEAMGYTEKAAAIFLQTEGDDSEEYALALKHLAEFNSFFGNYQKALSQRTKVVNILKERLGETHFDYALALNSLATENYKYGNYQEAIEQFIEVGKLFKDVHLSNYATSLGNLASCYSDVGNYQEAVRLGSEALKIEESLGTENPRYALTLSNLADYYCDLGNYQEAIRMGTEALRIQKESYGRNHPNYVVILNNLSCYYSDLGNNQEAIRLATEALKIYELVFGENHPDYAGTLSNLAEFYYETGDYYKAVELGTQAMTILKNILGDKHPEYALSLDNLAAYYYFQGDLSESIKLVTEALNIDKYVFGDRNPYYAGDLNHLACYNHYAKNTKERDKCAKESLELGKELIIGNFATMTPSEMNIFLRTKKHLIEEVPAATIAYNALLLSKGMLLNAEMGMNELILESGNEEALKMFEHIRMNTLVMNKQLEKPIAERYLNVDSLRAEIEKERKQLAVQSKEFGDFTKSFNVAWQDVRDNLKQNEAAIEFGTLTKDEIFSSNHCTRALILKRDSKEPIDIYLEFDSTKDFKSNILANWPAIQRHLNGISKVYFSPSAELYSTPIENYIDDGREYIRVSSTREVALSNYGKPKTSKPMKLYGGLAYSMSVDGMAKVNVQYKLAESKPADLYAMRSSREALNNVSFKYLKGTLDEVRNIESIAKAHKKSCEVLSGELGTEESLRTIDGKKYSILHFATHGFYWTEEEAEDLAEWNRLSFLATDSKSPKYVEDKSMTRSGLIFSGANIALGGEELPKGMEDGIATAQEISRLDLRGCDLVVLSACQTGLGEVSGEGVFGLQRGFKKAGVNSILMSLWEVDDRATQILMTEFYKHYLGGKTKRESLRKAQEYVKSRPGFSNPKYWAAFILLDGLD